MISKGVKMAKRSFEEAFKEPEPPPIFSKGCILLLGDTVDLFELVDHLNSNLNDLMARGEHSKILILDGTHGSKDGGDSLTEREFYNRKGLEQTCEILGTRHHLRKKRSMAPRYEKIKPYTERELKEWESRKYKARHHGKVKKVQALRKKLHKNDASVGIANLGYFYKDPKALVKYITKCDPSAIILNFCHSEKSESRWLLQRSGLLGKIFLNNDRVLLTGNKTIKLDFHQEELIKEVELKLGKLRSMPLPGGPRPHVFILGPAGETVS